MMTTIRDIPLNCPEATYVQPDYKEAGMNNFTNLVPVSYTHLTLPTI